ncbi:MAG: hypothetical protein BWY06_03401 [Candidatus Latescibacteria bacterium ADurb.Bin168]|nr:MAG: hypothetical protein BWY06_03401 [Candidatus Latescibacteria bacterium ADurb.Bin168]
MKVNVRVERGILLVGNRAQLNGLQRETHRIGWAEKAKPKPADVRIFGNVREVGHDGPDELRRVRFERHRYHKAVRGNAPNPVHPACHDPPECHAQLEALELEGRSGIRQRDTNTPEIDVSEDVGVQPADIGLNTGE